MVAYITRPAFALEEKGDKKPCHLREMNQNKEQYSCVETIKQ
jgi:hypothetical protein